MVSVQELETAQLREASAAKEQAAAESALREAEAEMAEFAGNAPAGTNTVLRSRSGQSAGHRLRAPRL